MNTIVITIGGEINQGGDKTDAIYFAMSEYNISNENKSIEWQESKMKLPCEIAECSAVLTDIDTFEPKIHIFGGIDINGEETDSHFMVTLRDVIHPYPFLTKNMMQVNKNI